YRPGREVVGPGDRPIPRACGPEVREGRRWSKLRHRKMVGPKPPHAGERGRREGIHSFRRVVAGPLDGVEVVCDLAPGRRVGDKPSGWKTGLRPGGRQDVRSRPDTAIERVTRRKADFGPRYARGCAGTSADFIPRTVTESSYLSARAMTSGKTDSTTATSSAVVSRPRESRTSPLASSFAAPRATITCDGSNEPAEHADPLEAQTPSRSNPANNVMLSTPRTVKAVVFANRSSGRRGLRSTTTR